MFIDSSEKVFHMQPQHVSSKKMGVAAVCWDGAVVLASLLTGYLTAFEKRTSHNFPVHITYPRDEASGLLCANSLLCLLHNEPQSQRNVLLERHQN